MFGIVGVLISAVVSLILFIAFLSMWSHLGEINKTLKDLRLIHIARDTREGFPPTDKKGRMLKG